MQNTSAEVTALWPTDEQVVDYLVRYFPKIARELHAPKQYVKAIYANQIRAAREGWTTKGREPVRSLWTFWIRSHDLEHISYLTNAATSISQRDSAGVKEEQTGNDIDVAVNMFDALKIDDTDEGFVTVEDPVKDQGAFDFMFAEPSFDPLPRRGREGTSDTSVIQKHLEDKPGVKDVPVGESDALATKESFIRFFMLDALPPVPTSSRNVADLLADGRIWSFSKT